MVLDPCYAPGYRNFDVCFLLSCALESSYLGRLSAIKVELELEFSASRDPPFCLFTSGTHTFSVFLIHAKHQKQSVSRRLMQATTLLPNFANRFRSIQSALVQTSLLQSICRPASSHPL